MPTDLLIRPSALVDQWRTAASDFHPAGPLFSSQYAEYDLINDGRAETPASCSACTASRTGQCC
jgi:hypothetical protein